MNAQQQGTWSSISNYLDGTEDDVLWAEQYDKSDTDEGDMYDAMMTHKQIQQMFREESDDDDDEVMMMMVIIIISAVTIKIMR